MELAVLGLALSAFLAVSVRSAGRRRDSSPGGLACLRGVGGLGLAAMAILALRYGAPLAAAIAALGAVPLLRGLAGSARGAGATVSTRAHGPADHRSESISLDDRRAA